MTLHQALDTLPALVALAFNLRRLALVLALLPQILVLGLGQGFIICIADDGHFQLEVAASDCCPAISPSAQDKNSEVTQNESDCGSCSDYRIAFDSRLYQSSNVSSLKLAASALLLAELPRLPETASSSYSLSDLPADGLAPLHLSHLRSTLLRC